ncbi:MAG TPA: YebC/PmpR family DNA-binding transcriptional regulator, partial [Spirochaetota bacterium]|nr:YebC/PmpR family DNA-binding transcriptional regulator [Spirochaetota bacterium]
IRYEGYGPGGVAIMVDCLTDNRNRTTPEIRTIFSKNGGNLGETGCVGYNFERKGVVHVDAGAIAEDNLMELLLDFDIHDIRTEDKVIVVTTSPEAYNDVYSAIKNKGLATAYNEITFLPKSTVSLNEKTAQQCLRLIDLLDDHDDVQNVYSNYDIPDEVMMALGEA